MSTNMTSDKECNTQNSQIEKKQNNEMSNNNTSSIKCKKIGNYVLAKTIGQGTFGKVKIGIHLPTHQKVAIKILDKSKIKDEMDVERISREIHILKMLRHKNLVQLYDTVTSNRHIYLIMEYVEGGDLYEFINNNKRLPEEKACMIYQQLIAAVEYIHKLGVVHRDIKPENILLDLEQNVIKLVDFGLSNSYKPGERVKTACGSPCYAAPEMISGKPYAGLMSDIWSSGVVLFCMLCGYLPFDDNNIKKLYKKISNGDYQIPKFLSNPARDLISNLLQVDLNKRYRIDDIKAHPWFSRYNNIKIDRGILLDVDKIRIDEEIVRKVKDLKAYRDNIKITYESITDTILKNMHNNITTAYYLLLAKYKPFTGVEDSNFEQEDTDSVNKSAPVPNSKIAKANSLLTPNLKKHNLNLGKITKPEELITGPVPAISDHNSDNGEINNLTTINNNNNSSFTFTSNTNTYGNVNTEGKSDTIIATMKGIKTDKANGENKNSGINDDRLKSYSNVGNYTLHNNIDNFSRNNPHSQGYMPTDFNKSLNVVVINNILTDISLKKDNDVLFTSGNKRNYHSGIKNTITIDRSKLNFSFKFWNSEKEKDKSFNNRSPSKSSSKSPSKSAGKTKYSEKKTLESGNLKKTSDLQSSIITDKKGLNQNKSKIKTISDLNTIKKVENETITSNKANDIIKAVKAKKELIFTNNFLSNSKKVNMKNLSSIYKNAAVNGNNKVKKENNSKVLLKTSNNQIKTSIDKSPELKKEKDTIVQDSSAKPSTVSIKTNSSTVNTNSKLKFNSKNQRENKFIFVSPENSLTNLNQHEESNVKNKSIIGGLRLSLNKSINKSTNKSKLQSRGNSQDHNKIGTSYKFSSKNVTNKNNSNFLKYQLFNDNLLKNKLEKKLNNFPNGKINTSEQRNEDNNKIIRKNISPISPSSPLSRSPLKFSKNAISTSKNNNSSLNNSNTNTLNKSRMAHNQSKLKKLYDNESFNFENSSFLTKNENSFNVSIARSKEKNGNGIIQQMKNSKTKITISPFPSANNKKSTGKDPMINFLNTSLNNMNSSNPQPLELSGNNTNTNSYLNNNTPSNNYSKINLYKYKPDFLKSNILSSGFKNNHKRHAGVGINTTTNNLNNSNNISMIGSSFHKNKQYNIHNNSIQLNSTISKKKESNLFNFSNI